MRYDNFIVAKGVPELKIKQIQRVMDWGVGRTNAIMQFKCNNA